jgi:hypothetical protein
MKVYKVEGGTLQVGQGASLLLVKAQAASRAHQLVGAEKLGADVVRATARELLHFKAGEVLGLAVVDKSMAHLLVEVDKPGSKGPAAILARAILDMEDREAVIAANRAGR